jgi:hypothetical protein
MIATGGNEVDLCRNHSTTTDARSCADRMIVVPEQAVRS